MTLLLVDDEPFVIQELANTMDARKLGLHQVLLAYNAVQAQSLFQQYQIDIIVTDVEMPQISGLELLAWVKANHPQTIGVILTCHSVFRYAQEALRLGCADYILKPVMIDDLEKTISRVIRGLMIEEQEGQDRRESTVVQRAKMFINDNIHLPLIRGDVASHVFLTADYLDRRFKAETGETIFSYIQQKKVSVAKQMLLKTDMNISEISEKLGYNSLSNFSFTFKQATGMSPKAFREKGKSS